MIGRTLKHYRIVRQLGAGGMGEVYLAEDTSLQREIALKVLPPDLASAPERRQRFEREARAVAALNHPNIVVVHSIEEDEGLHFMTMELVEGRTLSAIIPPAGLPLERFFDLAIPLADALGSAHEKGVAHRDLKPSNVMVTGEGRVKILDFGLAKLAEKPSDDEPSTELPTGHLTEEGTVVGTAAYMSPEQAEGKRVDHRSDIFSLGILLYQMATGEAPFKGDTKISLISSIVKDHPVPVTEIRQTLPRHLARILGHCLEKDPERRYQSAKDLRNDLAVLKTEVDSGELLTTGATREAAGASSAGPGRAGMAWLAVAAVVLTVAAVAYSMLGGAGDAASVPAVLRIATADSTTGVYYPIGTGIAEIVERELGNVDIEVLATDGSFENVFLLDRGEVDLAIAQNDIVFSSVKTDRVLGHPSTGISGLAVLYQEMAHVVVRNESAISTIEDLAGKTVNLSLPESGSRFTSEILLSHFGITLDGLTPSFLDATDANLGLLDGSIDASMQWVAAPYPLLQQLFRGGRVHLLAIDQQVVEGLRANQPFLVPGTIPAATYPNQPAPVSTVAVNALLVGSTTLDEDLVYRLLEAIFGNISDLIAHHPRAADISPATAVGLENGMPIDLHPGAERFWREQGRR